MKPTIFKPTLFNSNKNQAGKVSLTLIVLITILTLTPNAFAQLNYRWGWQSGSNTIGQHGSYGTKGVATRSNVPGWREYATSWRDPDGNLWLFGGDGSDGSGIGGKL
ncbi:MAG TPA: hypothetical protein VJ991_00005, partial [Balneolales bacterium]|nr:hypothetical protein [Balneolales bacterium]